MYTSGNEPVTRWSTIFQYETVTRRNWEDHDATYFAKSRCYDKWRVQRYSGDRYLFQTWNQEKQSGFKEATSLSDTEELLHLVGMAKPMLNSGTHFFISSHCLALLNVLNHNSKQNIFTLGFHFTILEQVYELNCKTSMYIETRIFFFWKPLTEKSRLPSPANENQLSPILIRYSSSKTQIEQEIRFLLIVNHLTKQYVNQKTIDYPDNRPKKYL